MSLPLVYALLAWQQPTPAPTAPSVPQPIARVDVKPAEYALQVGDTVRLHAVAYDSSGRAMPEAVIRWFASGGRFEGSVDSTGLVSAGSTGTLNVAAVAGLAGGGEVHRRLRTHHGAPAAGRDDRRDATAGADARRHVAGARGGALRAQRRPAL